MKSIIVEIAADGSLTVEAVGYKGAMCLKATKAIEDALGKVNKSAKKPEFYQRDEQVRVTQ